MGSILSKSAGHKEDTQMTGAKRSRAESDQDEQPRKVVRNNGSQEDAVLSASSTTTTNTISTTTVVKKKRHATGKERKEHFEQTRTWQKDTEDKTDKKETQTRPPNTDADKETRYPKRKVALLIGFCGTGYQGMQFNPGANTIESVLFDALAKAQAISKANAIDPKKVQWVRTARTDKGVHAAGNVVSLKMQFPLSDHQAMVDAINAQLPEQIRVFDFIDVIRSFHAKTHCDSRVYEYLLPSYAFAAPVAQILKDAPSSDSDLKIMNQDASIVKYISRPTEDEIKEKESYRISKETLNAFRKALDKFIGTHNFHNYTIGRPSTDRSSNRYLINITASDPLYIDNVEWISVKLHGQSFMIHQIRKMISMAVLIVRSGTPLSLIDESFKDTKINIPKAPALGLLLERPVFDSYNNRLTERQNQKDHGPITFEPYKKTIDEFKKKYIYSKVFEAEREERGFDSFLASVDNSFTNDFSYLNPEGVIPEECIVITKHTQ